MLTKDLKVGETIQSNNEKLILSKDEIEYIDIQLVNAPFTITKLKNGECRVNINYSFEYNYQYIKDFINNIHKITNVK